MTAARDLAAWRRLHDRAKAMAERSIGRSFAEPGMNRRYNDLMDEVAVLARKLRELALESKGPTWENVMHEQVPKRPAEVK